MENFMKKYSFWLTSLLGAGAIIWLIIGWKDMDMVIKLPIIYIVALAVHEIEELKFPGGFVELVLAMTGIEIRNIGIAKFGPVDVYFICDGYPGSYWGIYMAGNGNFIYWMYRNICTFGGCTGESGKVLFTRADNGGLCTISGCSVWLLLFIC